MVSILPTNVKGQSHGKRCHTLWNKRDAFSTFPIMVLWYFLKRTCSNLKPGSRTIENEDIFLSTILHSLAPSFPSGTYWPPLLLCPSGCYIPNTSHTKARWNLLLLSLTSWEWVEGWWQQEQFPEKESWGRWPRRVHSRRLVLDVGRGLEITTVVPLGQSFSIAYSSSGASWRVVLKNLRF